ncbi:M20/M25/M40 family metallo-hydrolase [Staphylococcus epidermidis]|uniref:M20/M25/M40 family metallo-hydrolase n=1 Tax=Staphylococcus epidermidis TaxID=1282 RepID=UPI0032B82BA5
MDIDLTYSRLPGAVVNDAHLTQEAIEVAKNVGYHVSMLDEPVYYWRGFFRLYRRIPRCFAFIGSDSKYDLHHPKYHPDERILEKVPQYFVQLVQRLLT